MVVGVGPKADHVEAAGGERVAECRGIADPAETGRAAASKRGQRFDPVWHGGGLAWGAGRDGAV